MAKKTTPVYEADSEYVFSLTASIRVDGIRLSRMDQHSAKGDFLNRIVKQEGADVIANAERR